MSNEVLEATATASESVAPQVLSFEEAVQQRIQKRSAKPQPKEEVLSQPDKTEESEEESTEAIAQEEGIPNEDELTEAEKSDPAGKGKSRLLDRVSKLSSERKELKSKLEALEAQVKQLSSKKPEEEVFKAAPKPERNPYKDVKTVEALQQKFNEANEVIEWADYVLEQNEDARSDDVVYLNGEPIVYEGKQLTKALIKGVQREQRKNVKEHLPARYSELQAIEGRKAQRKQLQEQAKTELNWMGDMESDVYRQFNGIMDGPVVKAILDKTPEAEPFIDYLVAHASNSIWGRKEIQLTDKKPSVEPPKVSAPARATPNTDITADRKVKEYQERFKQSGSWQDAVKVRTQQIANRRK